MSDTDKTRSSGQCISKDPKFYDLLELANEAPKKKECFKYLLESSIRIKFQTAAAEYKEIKEVLHF